MTYAEVKTGDVIDGVKITDVEKNDLHLSFTFDIIGGGWSFLVIYPELRERSKVQVKRS